MKSLFINEGNFESHKSSVKRGESSYIKEGNFELHKSSVKSFILKFSKLHV